MRVEDLDLRALRERANVTIETAAEMCGVSRRIWQRWERPKEDRHRNTKAIPSSVIELFCLKAGLEVPKELVDLRNEYYADDDDGTETEA